MISVANSLNAQKIGTVHIEDILRREAIEINGVEFTTYVDAWVSLDNSGNIEIDSIDFHDAIFIKCGAWDVKCASLPKSIKEKFDRMLEFEILKQAAKLPINRFERGEE